MFFKKRVLIKLIIGGTVNGKLIKDVKPDILHGYRFFQELPGGQMSCSDIYQSAEGNKVVVKSLIFLRNQDELQKFLNRKKFSLV